MPGMPERLLKIIWGRFIPFWNFCLINNMAGTPTGDSATDGGRGCLVSLNVVPLAGHKQRMAV